MGFIWKHNALKYMKKIIIFLLIANFAQAQLPAVVDGGSKIETRGLVTWINPSYKTCYSGSGIRLINLKNPLADTSIMDGGVTFSGSFGGVLNFDGINDIVYNNLFGNVFNTNRFTFEIWVKPTVINKTQNLFFSYDFVANITALNIRLVNTSIFLTARINGVDRNTNTGTSLVNSTTYQHIVGTYDGTNLSIYYNGSLIVSNVWTGTFYSTSNMYFSNSVGSQDLYASIACYRVYNSCLTATEILRNYNAEKNRFQ